MKYRTPPTLPSFLPLGFIQLHAHPLATGELRGSRRTAAAPSGENKGGYGWVALGGHNITGTRNSLGGPVVKSQHFHCSVPGSCKLHRVAKNHQWQPAAWRCMRSPRLKSQHLSFGHHHSLRDLTILCLSVLICEMGVEIAAPTLQDCYRAALSNVVNSH